jgi:hypothetical protein
MKNLLTSFMFLTTRPSTNGGLRFAINTGAGEQQVNTSAPLTVGVWQHVAVTLRGSTATIYLNGTAVGTNTGVTLRPSSLGPSTNNFIGKSQFSADPALTASVDDFRIYSKGLTAAEVQVLATPDVTVSVASGTLLGFYVNNTSSGTLVLRVGVPVPPALLALARPLALSVTVAEALGQAEAVAQAEAVGAVAAGADAVSVM